MKKKPPIAAVITPSGSSFEPGTSSRADIDPHGEDRSDEAGNGHRSPHLRPGDPARDMRNDEADEADRAARRDEQPVKVRWL